MANVGPFRWYLDSVAYNAVSAWVTGIPTAVGALIRATAPTVGNERIFVCIITGTTQAAEPAWVNTKGAKTAEAGGPTWQECTGQPGVNGDIINSPTWLQNKNTAVSLGLVIYDSVSLSLQIVTTNGTTGNAGQPAFSATAGTTTGDNTVTWTSLGLASTFGAFAAPHARAVNSITATWATGGDFVFTASEHAETNAAQIILTSPGTQAAPITFVSVNKAGNIPPQQADSLAGATLTTSGTVNISISGAIKMVGFTFSAAASVLLAGTGASKQHFQHCKMIVSTRNNPGDLLGLANGANTYVKFEDVTVKFGNVGNTIKTISGTGAGLFEWLNTALAIDNSGSIPTFLFTPPGSSIYTMNLHGVDLSAVNTTLFSNAAAVAAVISDCKLNASYTLFSGALGVNVATSVMFINSDSSATGYRLEWHDTYGDITTETTITLKNGASDGVQSVSHKYVSTSNANVSLPLVWPPLEKKFGVWNTTIGKSVTATVQIISSGTLNNNDIWLEVEYLGSASSPLSSFVNNGLANPVATAVPQTSSTANWNSQPATPVTQQLQVSFTPQLVGYVYGRIYVGKATATIYVDPELTLK